MRQETTKSFAKAVFITLFAIIMTGCVQMPQNAEVVPSMTPPPADDMDSTARNPGSLYNPGQAQHLFSDNRARRVGDILVVNIVEVSSGKHSANTNTKRDNYMDMSVASFFKKDEIGIDPLGGSNILGLRSNVGDGTNGTGLAVSSITKNQFKGTASTDRNGDVKATIGARVVKVLPGGVMQVEGAREVRVNEETQIMVVSGLVRPRDIGPDNSITSSQMANFTTEYYGRGVVADKQKAGWLMRLLDNVWPF